MELSDQEILIGFWVPSGLKIAAREPNGRINALRTSLDHLPPAKRRELERVVQILFDEFGIATVIATSDWKRGARILKIILYGSYARGGWVDEPHTAKGYQSDFDLLVIVNHKKLTDRAEFWSAAEDRLNRELLIVGALRTPVNIIVHTLAEVNDGLAQGRYFFMDIAKDDIALYEAEGTDLLTPRPITAEQALAAARDYFQEWFGKYSSALQGAARYMEDAEPNDAAFTLHQAVERAYHCVLLVCTLYTPRVHNLAFLRVQAERIDAGLVDVWPRSTKWERAMFEKLKEAYVKARYSRHFDIRQEELVWLGERVVALGHAVRLVCAERLDELERRSAG